MAQFSSADSDLRLVDVIHRRARSNRRSRLDIRIAHVEIQAIIQLSFSESQ